MLEEALNISPWIHHYRRFIYEKNNNMMLKDCLNYDDVKYIQFVVNPYRRAVSSYLHGMKHCYLIK